MVMSLAGVPLTMSAYSERGVRAAQAQLRLLRASSPLAAGKVPARAASLDSVHPQLYLSAALDWVPLKTYAQKIPKKLGSILRARLPSLFGPPTP
jgi:hypothetical protein